jgi:hypothetical protein
LANQAEFLVYGQGVFPVLVSATATPTLLSSVWSEVLGYGSIEVEHAPLVVGAYSVSGGSLGAEVALGNLPSVVEFPSAALPASTTVTFGASTLARSVVAGTSFVDAASSVVGAGSETLGLGQTTLNKLSGTPYELVFSGGVDSFVFAGRKLSTTMSVAFPPSATSYPLVAWTFLNTQVSVVLEKTTTNMGVFRLYRGAALVGQPSAEFNPTVPFSLEIIDATGDNNGYLAVRVSGVVVLGARASDLLDDQLVDARQGVTALALTLGSPLVPVLFSADLGTKSFITAGFRGQDSRDLLSLVSSELSVVVSSGVAPPSPGYQGTGKGAFGAFAEYLPDVDVVQVVVSFNAAAVPLQFTGSVSLLTAQAMVMDQIAIDESFMLVGESEVSVLFAHPKSWAGLLAGVEVTIDGTVYSVQIPVVELGMNHLRGYLTQQPPSWSYPRQPTTTAQFGPATIIA